MKNTWIQSLTCLSFSLLLAADARAETFDLTFTSLPSDQGWTFAGSQSLLVENDAYIVDGSSLVQTTVDYGEGIQAYYKIENIVNSSEPISLSFTAQVLSYERLSGGNTGWAFYVRIVDTTSILRLGLTDNSVVIQGEAMSLDTTAVHDYAFEFVPGGNYEFFVDGQLWKTGITSGISGGNVISFGDQSSNENMDIEITAFSFSIASGAAPDVEIGKTVNNSYPIPNEPVEFTVTVNNVGIGVAADLVVVDQLPGELSIPPGTAASTNIGDYDPATGEWFIGNLDVGVEAILAVPAVVNDPSPPPCIANLASASHPRDQNSLNDEAYAVVHSNNVDRCVDIDVDFDISVGPPFFVFPTCDSQDRYSGSIDVVNNGPDAARNVVVSISQDPVVGPNLRFNDVDCVNAPAASCNVPQIAAGGTVTLEVTSALFQSYSQFTQTISVNATTSDSDFNLSNNNPSDSGSVGGFSSCTDWPEIDIADPFVGVGGCFIATAAYGSPMHYHLDSLRGFRDQYMMTNRFGRALVGIYYRYSPPIADFIAQREWLRAIVRSLLAPIVYAIEFPKLAALLALLLIRIALVLRRHRRLAASGISVN